MKNNAPCATVKSCLTRQDTVYCLPDAHPAQRMFMINQPFCGEIFVDDKRLPFNQSLYINVTNDESNNTQLNLFDAPPPFTLDSIIGKYGVKWRIKKVKRKFLVNQYLLTLIDQNIEVFCSTGHKFGDMMEQAITTLPK